MVQYRYDQRGVSASKDEVHAAIKNLVKGLYPNAFCKIIPDVAGMDPDYCNLMHADTAGTKTSLSQRNPKNRCRHSRGTNSKLKIFGFQRRFFATPTLNARRRSQRRFNRRLHSF